MDEKLKQVKTIFKDLSLKKIKSFDVLTGGFSNDTYLFNDAYVLKMPKSYVQPFINYENEDKILDYLKLNKQVETCYLYDYEKGYKISKFFHGVRPYYLTPNDFQIKAVAKFLKKLHKYVIKDDILSFDCINRIITYKKFCDKKIDGRYERKVLNRVKKILEKEKMVLCHNDLVQGNLLFKVDKLFVIDWEFAGLNSIYFDLASFISENNLNDLQTKFFLKSYFGSTLNQTKIKKVNAFIDFENILWYYWASMMYINSFQEIYDKIKQEKYQKIVNCINEKR